MEHTEQVRLIKELMARLDAGVTVDAGGFRRNPTTVYTDPELAATEWDRFFRHHPQMIGLSGDLPRPGSFITFNDVGVPVLATRDAEGTFRAMVNVCRHRGVILTEEPRGTARRFTCPFHGWTYDGTGALVGVPRRDHFGDIDPACHGLIRLPAEERHGMLWIHPDPDGRLDVAGLLGPELDAELASWGLDRLEVLGGDTYEMPLNWKLAMDTFGETYHFPTLHRNTLAMGFHGNVQLYDTYGRHHRMILCRRTIDELRELPEDRWHLLYATLPVYWLFPNVQLMPSWEGCYLVRAYPVPGEPGRHVSRVGFYRWPDAELPPEAAAALAEGFAGIIRDEDYASAASTQRAASAGAVHELLFGRNEPALHHYHNTYRRALGMPELPLLERP